MRIGIIGLGKHALGKVIPLVLQLGHEIIAFDRLGEARQKLNGAGFGQVGSTASRYELCKLSDAVIYTGPPDDAGRFTDRFVRYRLPTLFEKPLGKTVEQAKRILFWWPEDLHAQVAHQIRYHPLVTILKEMIRDGAFGHLNGLRAYAVVPRKEQQKPLGVLEDIGCHYIDLMSFLTDRLPDRWVVTPVSIDAPGGQEQRVTLTFSDNEQLFQGAFALWRTDSRPEFRCLEVIGTLGSATLDMSGTPALGRPRYTWDLSWYSGGESGRKSEKTEPYLGLLDEFIACAAGEAMKVGTTLRQAVATRAFIDEVYEQAKVIAVVR